MSSHNGVNPNTNATGIELRLDQLADGLKTALPAGTTTVVIGGVAHAVADLEKRVASILKPWKEIRAAHAVIRAVMATREEDVREAVSFLADARLAIASLLGKQNQALTRFGFKPEKPRAKLTPEARLVRAEKMRLTRELRGTKGRRQKEALRATGTPRIVIAPTGADAAPAPAAPAPAAPVIGPTVPTNDHRTAV